MSLFFLTTKKMECDKGLIFFERVLTYRTALIRVGEFADFISESFFDLNDGVGVEAIAFGRV